MKSFRQLTVETLDAVEFDNLSKYKATTIIVAAHKAELTALTNKLTAFRAEELKRMRRATR